MGCLSVIVTGERRRRWCQQTLYATYLCGGKELDVAVSRLEQVTKDRDRVAYLSAPTKRGKSAAILPMFCRSVELGSENSFTHYLYMPFANNDGNCNSP